MPLKSPFLTGVLAHIPEGERGKAETELIALEEGNLRQADYSKMVSEANAAKAKFDELYEANTKWFQERQADLATLDALRTENTELKTKVTTAPTDPTKVSADVITKKDLEATLDTMERGAVGFFTELNALSLQHYQQFGEILDTSKLLTDKRVQQIGLRGVYADVYKEPLAAKAKAAEDARIDAIRKEERAKVQAEMAGSHHPYPVVGNEPSALDAIEAVRTGQTATVKTVDDMASEYARLQGVRAGATP